MPPRGMSRECPRARALGRFVARWLDLAAGLRSPPRRLRRIGWQRALDPPAGGWAAGEPPPRTGQCGRDPDRRRRGAARDGRRAAAGRVARPPDRVVLHAGFALRRDARASRPAQPARRARRANRRPRARLGRRSAAALSAVAPRRPRGARRADAQHADPVQARLERAADALPSREDDRDRRSGRVRRRHRSHLRSGRPLRHEPSIRRAAHVGWHDACARIEGPAVADVAEHFRMRWHEVSRRTTRAGQTAASPPATPSCRSCAPFRNTSTRPCRAATFGSSSPTCARCAQRSGSSTSRTSFCGRRRSKPFSSTSSRTHRGPTSGCCSCCRRRPTAAPTTHAASSAELIEADADAGRLLACTLYARSGALTDHVYVHAKIAIVDDAVADRRLREPQRALPLQRHRDEHRPPRSSPRRRHPPAAVGRAPGAVGGASCRPIPSPRSRSSGNRSARNSSTPPRRPAADPPARTPAERLAALEPRCSARSPDCSSTADDGGTVTARRARRSRKASRGLGARHPRHRGPRARVLEAPARRRAALPRDRDLRGDAARDRGASPPARADRRRDRHPLPRDRRAVRTDRLARRPARADAGRERARCLRPADLRRAI